MKIESMLNQFMELDTEAGSNRESTSQYGAESEGGRSSFPLPTPSPECAPPSTPSVQPDSRTRTPWDAGGYSLPRDAGLANSSRPPFSAISWGEQQQHSKGLHNASNVHSRHVSMEKSANMKSHGASAPYPLPVRTPSIPDVYQDAWTPKRSSLWTDYNPSPGVRSHRISDSRSSFSSCCSSTFSAGHSRFSSVSTINGSHPLAPGIADLEAKLERLPRLTAPLPAVVTVPPMNPDTRLPQGVTVTSAGPLPSGGPSESILQARMMRRKHNHLSEDQSPLLLSYLKQRDSFLRASDPVHKRTISAPSPAQASSLSPFAPRQSQPTVLPPQQITKLNDRTGLEQYPWAHSEESSPAPSMASKSPFEAQGSMALPADSLQTAPGNPAPYTSPNDRVVAACRRFRKVDVNMPLEGGDICMAVESCTTGSVPRKVISHLFGRNKVCTRRIPERVWVCMCRKHYQRIRYRTGADFSVTQIGMVYEQIVRMIFWSRGLENPNKTNQERIAIRSWTFSIRRREAKRLTDTTSRDLVPRWIMQSLGEGKTHDEILDIVERLHQEIQQGSLKDVPPVEFLPEVVDALATASAQLPSHFSNQGDATFAHRPTPSGHSGEAAESPISFVKDSSPLEPVQEEGSMSEHSSEHSSFSPTPPAANIGPRLVHSSQPYDDDAPNRTTNYTFGINTPHSNSGMALDTDRRSSLAYNDSQNPIPPSMSYFSINHQTQAPTIDPRGSFNSVPYAQTAYAGTGIYGSNEYVLTDRNPSMRAHAPVNEGRAPYVPEYAVHTSRDRRNFLATTVNPQATPVHLGYTHHGPAPTQFPAVDYLYQGSSANHSQFSLNDVHLVPDEHSYAGVPRLQTHQPSWYTAMTGSNTRIGRSGDGRQQQSSAYASEPGHHSSSQLSGEGLSESSCVGFGHGEGVSATDTTTPYHPSYQHGYGSTGGFDNSYARGNQLAYQHNWSRSEGEKDRCGD
ncbi:hypothetical protein F66182_9877 [Fusarium sp. NRRL 66182]|nr:hypothetical protein F66182_9877 [Fusarium sp. NRRL 66182]